MTRDSRTLVLLTTNHPYTHTGGETMFVGPELPALTGAFERVVLVPLYDDGARLPLPVGCELDCGLAGRWRTARLCWLMRALRWPGFAAELRRGLWHGGWVGAARVWRWAAVATAAWYWMLEALPNRGRGKVLLCTYWRGGQTLAAVRWAQREGAAVATRVHRYELYDEAFDPPFQPWTSIYAELSRILTVSQQGSDYLARRGIERVTVARLGVAAAPVRARSSADGGWRVVSCSALTPVKRVELVAGVVVELARRHPERPLHWTHFGGGPTLAAVRRVIGDSPPSRLSVNLAGQVDNDRVLQHYRDEPVDIFVLLSRSEGLPVSIQEALAHGIPVVACDVGGVGEAVSTQAGNGALVPAEAPPSQIADVLERLLLAPPSEIARRRQAAWQRWSEDFDAARNPHRLAECLTSLAHEDPR